jgi:hypothetical protein
MKKTITNSLTIQELSFIQSRTLSRSADRAGCRSDAGRRDHAQSRLKTA